MKSNLLFVLLLCVSIFACGGESTVRSSDYKDNAARIERLGDLFVLRSDVIDAAYEIYDVNLNTRSIPGPTDRDYRIILKVDPRLLEKWHDPDLINSFPVDYSWADSILSTADGFDLKGKSVQYSGENKQMVIFEETGVVLVRIVQH